MKKKLPMTRSENMSKVKNKNTSLEIYIRKLLWHRNFRYRINYKKLAGKPDIYIQKYKTAIFVNGCFWHMHKNCKMASIPKTNYDFWEKKLKKNVERDEKEYDLLKKDNIKVIVIWGCEIKHMMKDKDFEDSYITNIIKKIVDNN